MADSELTHYSEQNYVINAFIKLVSLFLSQKFRLESAATRNRQGCHVNSKQRQLTNRKVNVSQRNMIAMNIQRANLDALHN